MRRSLVTRCATTLLGMSLAATVFLVPQMAAADPDAVKEAQKKVNKLQEEGSALDLEHTKLTEKLTKADKEVKTLDKDVATQRTKVSKLKTSLRSVAIAQYQQSGLGVTAKLVASPDEATMLKQLATMQTAERRSNGKLQQMQREQGNLTTLEKKLVKTRDDIAADKAKQAELVKQYDQKIADAEAVLAKLSAEERQRLEKLQQEEAKRRLQQVRDEDKQREQQNNGENPTPPTQKPGAQQPGTNEPAPTPAPPSTSRGAAAAVAYAKAQVGKAYVSGAEGPNAFDCSGLTMAAWRAAGVSLPRTSQAQAGAGVRVSLSQIQPGDLVIFYSGATHVGIYVGGGMLVDAANPRKGVRMISLANSWMPIHSIRRVG